MARAMRFGLDREKACGGLGSTSTPGRGQASCSSSEFLNGKKGRILEESVSIEHRIVGPCGLHEPDTI